MTAKRKSPGKRREYNRLYVRRWRARQTARCRIAGCLTRVEARGLCSAHYHKLLRYGDPTADRRPAEYAARTRRYRAAATTRMLGILPGSRTFAEAAANLGVSHQRVSQILTWLLGYPPRRPALALAELRELAKAGAGGKKP